MSHFKKIPPAKFERLWADKTITRAEIGRQVGLCEGAVFMRAKAMKLALRGLASKTPHIKDTELFKVMWMAGAGVDDIAAHFKVTPRTVGNTRERLGLKPRNRGQRPTATVMGILMARQAAADRAAHAARIAAE